MTGDTIGIDYDPMLAKVSVHAPSREEARVGMIAALAATRIGGIATNLDYLRQVAASAVFAEGRQLTSFL